MGAEQVTAISYIIGVVFLFVAVYHLLTLYRYVRNKESFKLPLWSFDTEHWTDRGLHHLRRFYIYAVMTPIFLFLIPAAMR